MTQPLTASPKFTIRYTLGLFTIADWIYTTLVTGSDDSLADFSKLSSEVFNDQMFFAGAFEQIQNLMADINDEKIVEEMINAKTFLLDKKPLLQMKNMSEEGMAKMAEEGHSVYSLLFGKKLAENIVFEEDFMPTEYTCIDGSDKKAAETTVPLHMVFTIDSILLEQVSKLLDMDNTTIVSETIDKFLTDPKLSCFANTFRFMQMVEQA